MNTLVVKLYPVLKFIVGIGMICGGILTFLGIARILDMIDMGRDFESTDALLMAYGGVGLVVVFYVQFLLLRYLTNKATLRNEAD